MSESRGRNSLGMDKFTGADSGEFRDTPILKEPRVIVGPAVFAAVWKMTFDKTEKLKTKQWLDAHIDLVIHGLKNHS